MSQNQMNAAEVTEYNNNQLAILKYKEDMREVMAKKPDWSVAPANAKFLVLNVNNGEKFGQWEWLTVPATVGHVFVEPRPIEYVNRF